MDAVLKQRCDLTHESGQEWKGEGIRRIQGRYETQGELLTPVDFDLLGTPIHNPVFQHTAARVELELGLTITALVGLTWRQHLDHQFGCGVQMPLWSEGRGTAGLADPHHVRGHIIVVREDHAWRKIRCTSPGLSTPGIESRSDPHARLLMVPVGLS